MGVGLCRFSCQIPLCALRRDRPNGNRNTEQDADPQVLRASVERTTSARGEQVSFAEPRTGRSKCIGFLHGAGGLSGGGGAILASVFRIEIRGAGYGLRER